MLNSDAPSERRINPPEKFESLKGEESELIHFHKQKACFFCDGNPLQKLPDCMLDAKPIDEHQREAAIQIKTSA